MASVDDLDRRVTALEARVRSNEVDIAGVNGKLQAILGGQDVLLGLVREQGRVLARQEAKLAAHDEKFTEHDARFERIDARFDGIDARFDGIDGKLDMIVDWIQPQP
jgi:hypothetical protein